MNVKLLSTSAGLALGMTAISAPSFAADPMGWYAGVNAGQSKAHFSGGDLDSIFASQGATSSSTVDDTDTGWKLYGGYRFNPNLALEGGYVDLGKFGFNSTISSPVGTASGSVKTKNGWFVDAVGILPLPANFSVFGKVGVYDIKTELNESGAFAGPPTTPFTVAGSHTHSDWKWGVGAGYEFTQNLGARLEWERFNKVRAGDGDATIKADVDLFSLGLVYKF